MDQENITFSKNQGKSYTMTDLHILGYNMSFGYEDWGDCYDIDVNKILLLKKSDQKYFVRYNDVNKNRIVPLQVEINHFSLGKLDIFAWTIEDATAQIDIRSNDGNFL